MHRTHGKTNSRAYQTWCKIKSRCLNSTSPDFKLYGGRGITIDPIWTTSFEAFYKEMGDPPEGQSIDRIQNNRGYEPGNCRWADPFIQQNNKRTNIKVSIDGKILNLREAARLLNLDYRALWWHIRIKKRTLAEALTHRYKPRGSIIPSV